MIYDNYVRKSIIDNLMSTNKNYNRVDYERLREMLKKSKGN